MEIAKKYQDQLPKIKKKIRASYDYFRDNYDRYNEFRRFVFESCLNSDEVNLLLSINKPQLEFNVLEAYVSRLLGEFSKQEPDIEVNAFDEDQADPLTIKVVQMHLKHVFGDNNNEHLRYEVYKDLLSGGFSTTKVVTDYESPMSMNQTIKFERCEPTLCGFDMAAKLAHKGDGQYCFELFPMEWELFKEDYPDVPAQQISFRQDVEGFNWSYLNSQQKMVMLVNWYQKKNVEKTIVQVRDGKVMTMDKYRKLVDEWNDITVPPSIVGKPRKTMLTTIERFKIIENVVLEHEITDFEMLPLVFIDGHSIMIKAAKNGAIRQVTRPYVYHAKGAQRLKNFAGISLANEIETTVQSKWMVAKEAIPKEEDFLDAYKNPQLASVIVYNSLYEENPDQPIQNPIREVQRTPAPPEIAQAFTGSDALIQNVLGSYDASLGINNNQLSGIAIVEGASQSNATAMPYIVGALQGFSRMAELYVNLMPKYITTPRTIPIVDEDGRRQYVKVNQQDGMDMNFDTNALNVSMKAGASFQVQKSRTIMMVKEMMGMSPLFAQFIAEKGMQFVLDNMEGKGIEQLKLLVDGWLQEYQKEKEAKMEAENANPAKIKAEIDKMKLDHEIEKDKHDYAIAIEKLKQEDRKIEADLQEAENSRKIAEIKAAAEIFAKRAEIKIARADQGHRHLKEALELHHAHHKLKHEIKHKGATKHG